MGVSTMTSTTNELYANLSPEVQEELTKHERTAPAAQGRRLVQYGVSPDQLIILNSGSAEITVPAAGKTISLGTAGPGRVFGLRSIICGQVSDTDVTCLEECHITLLSREVFLEVLRRNPQMYFAVVKVLSADLQKAHSFLRQNTGRPKPQETGPGA